MEDMKKVGGVVLVTGSLYTAAAGSREAAWGLARASQALAPDVGGSGGVLRAGLLRNGRVRIVSRFAILLQADPNPFQIVTDFLNSPILRIVGQLLVLLTGNTVGRSRVLDLHRRPPAGCRGHLVGHRGSDFPIHRDAHLPDSSTPPSTSSTRASEN